jgi:outer membrane lipoprotein SlyB
MNLKNSILILLASLFFLSGCAQNIGADNYSVESTGEVNRIVPGTIVSSRQVSVSGTKSTGRTVGVLAGAAAGSAIGGGIRSNILGAIGAGLLGGLVGGATEEAVTSQSAIEYIVQTQGGGLVTVTQGPEPAFSKGAKVLVLYGSQARIIADER